MERTPSQGGEHNNQSPTPPAESFLNERAFRDGTECVEESDPDGLMHRSAAALGTAALDEASAVEADDFPWVDAAQWDPNEVDDDDQAEARLDALFSHRLAALDELTDKWGSRYPAIVKLWNNAWEEFIPFLDYDIEIRKVICSTNAIESLNARYRRAVRARGHFPSEQAALKCLYLVTRSLDPKGTGQAKWTMRWKPALNAFALT